MGPVFPPGRPIGEVSNCLSESLPGILEVVALTMRNVVWLMHDGGASECLSASYEYC